LSAAEEAAPAAATAEAEALVAYAAETAAAYSDEYAAASGDLVAALDAVEADMQALTEDLDQVLAYLEKGAAAADQAAPQLDAAASAAAQAQQSAGDWAGRLGALCENRATEAAAVPATQVSGARMGVASSLKTYLQSVSGSGRRRAQPASDRPGEPGRRQCRRQPAGRRRRSGRTVRPGAVPDTAAGAG